MYVRLSGVHGGHGCLGLLGAVQTPTLVLRRRNDRSGSYREAVEEVAAGVANGKLVQVDGNVGIAEMDHEQVLEHMLSFLAEDAPPAPVVQPPPAIDTTPGIRYATSADGTKIAYTVRGESDVPLVGVYAWFSSGVEWLSAAELSQMGFGGIMAERGAYLIYARRGTEASQRDVSDVSFEVQLADLEAVVEHVGASMIDLIGFSDGASICLAYAAVHPERVRKVVLWGSFARGSEFINSEGAQRIATLIRSDWALARQTMAMSTMSSRPVSGTELRAGSAMLAEYTSQEVAAMYIEAIAGVDVTQHLSSVQAPVLVLHRKNDTFYPFEAGRAVATGLPNARLIPLEGDNPYVAPDSALIANLVIEFLDGAKPAPLPPAVVQPPRAIDTTPGIRYATSADGTKIAYEVAGGGAQTPIVQVIFWPVATSVR